MENKLETSLPYFRFTVEMLECIIDNNLSATQICVYALLELNKNIARGQTHKLPIGYFSASLNVSESTVYRAIARLKECGLFMPSDWGYIIGHLPYAELAKQTAEQAKFEKPKREFYVELRDRIAAYEDKTAVDNNATEASKSVIFSLFTALCKERNEKGGYYPKQSRGMHDDLAKFAPRS